jgi:hypothetical protein
MAYVALAARLAADHGGMAWRGEISKNSAGAAKLISVAAMASGVVASRYRAQNGNRHMLAKTPAESGGR